MNDAAQSQAILLFGDGASSGNPGPGGYGAILVFPNGHVTEIGGGEPDTTNNRMELAAVIAGLKRLESTDGPVVVYTDSTYVIRGITQWCWAWSRRGWKTADGKDVSNADLWKRLIAIVAKRGGKSIRWQYLPGHRGIPGNERADAIAVGFSKGRRPSLYDGPLLQYEIPIHDLPEQEIPLPEMRDRDTGPKPKALSYLSLVNGVVERHATWRECEARVKGRPGAKFKKAMSESEEREILRGWGARLKE